MDTATPGRRRILAWPRLPDGEEAGRLPSPAGTVGLKPTNGVTDGSWNQSAWNLGPSVHCHLTWTLFRVERKGRALRPQATLDWPGQSLLVLNGADQIHKDHNHSLGQACSPHR